MIDKARNHGRHLETLSAVFLLSLWIKEHDSFIVRGASSYIAMLCIAGFLGATWTASKISKCLCLEYDGIWEGKSKGDFPMKLAFILDILEMDWTIQHFLVPPCIWRMGHVWVCTDCISRGIGWGGPNFYTYTYIFYIVHVDEQFELLLRHLESAWSNFFLWQKKSTGDQLCQPKGLGPLEHLFCWSLLWFYALFSCCLHSETGGWSSSKRDIFLK